MHDFQHQSHQLTRCAPSSQAWTICHLSRPLVWKSKRGDCASCSSTKNFSESRPVAPPELVDCVWTHRSHSRMIRGFALSCFIQRAPSEIGPFRSAGMAALGANDWEIVFPNGKMRRNSRGIQEKTQTTARRRSLCRADADAIQATRNARSSADHPTKPPHNVFYAAPVRLCGVKSPVP